EPLPMIASPASTHTGPVKTGGRVFVSDHKRWTAPMKEATDILLKKHHGKKDMIRPVDQEYAAMVLSSSTDPNSMFHSTTKVHISQYVKHLAKLLNTSSSLNTSPEKRLERQQLWYSLTEGSDTTSFPVMTVTPAVIQPPAPSLTHEAIKKIVEEVMERQRGILLRGLNHYRGELFAYPMFLQIREREYADSTGHGVEQKKDREPPQSLGSQMHQKLVSTPGNTEDLRAEIESITVSLLRKKQDLYRQHG
ncbi:hypothetical protein QQF64_036424, partial [Cirrhinus molitorella]